MNTLLDSVRDYFGSLKSGDKLKYISGNNSVEILSIKNGGETIKFRRSSDENSSRPKILTLSNLQGIIAELEEGDPIHIETFFHSGGNIRTVYETLLAHSPRIAWCKINNQKHLKAFEHEAHLPGRLWRCDGSDWSSPEWALAVIIFKVIVKAKGTSSIPAPTPSLLEKVTNRNEKSWQARISNFNSFSNGGSFNGGDGTQELCKIWLDRYNSENRIVSQLASYASKDNPPEKELGDIEKLLGIKFRTAPIRSGNVKGNIEAHSLEISLITKPFVILTGNSGTGKTHLAEALAATYRNHEETAKAINIATVPVGADWTDSRAVVGFVNHLKSGQLNGSKTARPIYQSTAVVDLLLSAEADANKEVPHFLILDEMNLSHVERYFADFLSAMESREGRIRLHDEGPRDEANFRLPRFDGDPVGVPRFLAYPRNLFVIGTVNIDETTYMFSPKVLDRAHVIEFVVDRDDIAAFFENPKNPEQPRKVSDSEARNFLKLSTDVKSGGLESLPDDVSKDLNKHLMECLDLLQLGRFEFAYRTAREIVQYMQVCQHLAKDKTEWQSGERLSREQLKAGHSNWRSDLDGEILQKILPRLHGSRNRIGPLIGALSSYMHTSDVETAKAYFPESGSEIADKSIGDQDFAAMKGDEARFPRSFQKLKAMAKILVEEQFVSFIC